MNETGRVKLCKNGAKTDMDYFAALEPEMKNLSKKSGTVMGRIFHVVINTNYIASSSAFSPPTQF